MGKRQLILLLSIVVLCSVIIMILPRFVGVNEAQGNNLVGKAYEGNSKGPFAVFGGLILLLAAVIFFYFQPKNNFQERT